MTRYISFNRSNGKLRSSLKFLKKIHWRNLRYLDFVKFTGLYFNENKKIWWLCLVPTSVTRFAGDIGYRSCQMINISPKFRHSRFSDVYFSQQDWPRHCCYWNTSDSITVTAAAYFILLPHCTITAAPMFMTNQLGYKHKIQTPQTRTHRWVSASKM